MSNCHGFQKDKEGYKLFVEGDLSFCAGVVEEHVFKPWVKAPASPHKLLEGFAAYYADPEKPAIRVMNSKVQTLLGLTKPKTKLLRFPNSQYGLVMGYAGLFNSNKSETFKNWEFQDRPRARLIAALTSSTAGVVVFPPVNPMGLYAAQAFLENLETTRLALIPVPNNFDITFEGVPPLNPNTSTLLAYEAILKWTMML